MDSLSQLERDPCVILDASSTPIPEGVSVESATENRELTIGKLMRDLRDAKQRRDMIDADLSQAAGNLRTAATQIEALLAGQRCCTGSPLSRLDMDRVVQLLSDREALQRKIAAIQDELKRLQA